MNYIREINAFEDWLEHNYLTTLSQLLWYKLMYRCSRAGWPEWVSVDNLRLMADLRIESKNTFLRCRDGLIESGLIEYQKGKKGCPNRYRLIPFLEYGSKNEPQMEPETELYMEPQMELKTEPETGHIYKHKLKHKKSNTEVLPEKPESFSSQISEVCELYQSVCKSYPKLVKLSEARKKAIRARLNAGYTTEDFRKLFEMAEASDFLKGKNSRDWSATFDWLITDANIAKVLGGNYANKKGGTAAVSQPAGVKKTGFHNFEQRDTDYDAMMAAELREKLKRQEGGTET